MQRLTGLDAGFLSMETATGDGPRRAFRGRRSEPPALALSTRKRFSN